MNRRYGHAVDFYYDSKKVKYDKINPQKDPPENGPENETGNEPTSSVTQPVTQPPVTQPVIVDITDISQLASVPHIKSIPLYDNLKEEGIEPDGRDGQYSLTREGMKALPVGLDFQLLSVNAGMYQCSYMCPHFAWFTKTTLNVRVKRRSRSK